MTSADHDIYIEIDATPRLGQVIVYMGNVGDV
jgi:hypothetical protein